MRRVIHLILAAALAVPPGVFAETLTHDVSGADGIRDEDGRPDHSPGDTPGQATFGRGRDGDDGGHAVEVVENRRLRKKGWDAGALNLTISVTRDDKVRVQGTRSEPERPRSVSTLDDTIPLDPRSKLRLRADGGAGGDGGDGGRGQDGGKGADGRDAFDRIPGTNGDRGGNGGDEGHSTDGGDAGDGGQIVLRADIKDNDLVMLLDERSVSHARGGRAGSGNGPGSGGDGGDGGASGIYWTKEPVQRSEPEYDAEGKQTGTRTWTEYEDVSHFVPGGSDGPSGNDGRRSSRATYDGKDSVAGKFQYEVVDEKGRVASYDDPYWIHILPGFTLEGSHNGKYTDRASDFFEPGETITIRNLRIRNVGGSPSPKYQKVKLFISDNDGWIKSNGDEIFLPKVLEPGEEYDFGDEPITFHLVEKERDVAGLMRESDVVSPNGLVTRVEREFPDISSRSARKIRVQYPIEITPLQSLTSIAPGEAQLVMFRIKNISNQTIGSGFDHHGLRYARTEFRRTTGSTDAEHFVVSEKKDGGAVDPNAGISRLLEGLGPGQEIIVKTYVGYRADAQPYSKVEIQPELFLESILNPSEIKRIQYEPYTLRVAEAYEYTPGAKVLLIANAGLDAKVLGNIYTMAYKKGLILDIWDFSRYGYFDLTSKILDYGPFLELYRGGTVFIMGNTVETPGGKVRAQSLLKSDEVIEAQRRFGVSFAVFDTANEPEKTIARMSEPLPLDPRLPEDPDQIRTFESRNGFLTELKNAIHTQQEDGGDETAFVGKSRIPVYKTPLWPWSPPGYEVVERHAYDVLADTDAYLPEAKPWTDVKYLPQPVEVGRKALLWPTYHVGAVEISRAADDTKTSAVGYKIPAGQIENPDYFRSEAFSIAFDTVLKFQTKLDLFNKILMGKWSEHLANMPKPKKKIVESFENTPLEYARILFRTMLLDLIQEQRAIRPVDFTSKVAKKDLWDKLDLLKRFTQYSYDQFKLDPQSDEGRLLIDLIVGLRFYNRGVTTWVERVGWFWPFTGTNKNVEVSLVVAEMLDRLIEVVFDDVPGAKAIIEANLADVRKFAAKEGITRETLMKILDEKGLDERVIRDGKLNRERSARVRLPDRQAQLLADDGKRRNKAVQVKEETEKETALLRLENDACQKLLASGPGSLNFQKAEPHEIPTVLIPEPDSVTEPMSKEMSNVSFTKSGIPRISAGR